MKLKKKIGLLFVLLPLFLGALMVPENPLAFAQETADSKTVELSNGEVIEIAPDEILQEYHLSDVPTQQSGTGDPLNADESGIRIDTFTDEQLDYVSATQTTTTADLSVPLGDGWEGYGVYTNITSVTENRNWIENPGLDDSSQWTFLTHDEPSGFGPSYTNAMTSQWEANGHGAGDGCARFWMDGYYYDAGGGLYGDWYDVGDKAYMVQNLTIDRGDVSSIGISLDYWGDVAWGIMTGFFELFVSVGDPDNGGTYLWNLAYDAFEDDLTWYSTGYIEIDASFLTLPNVSIWVGLRTTALEWWRPDINPLGRMDNIVIYVTAKATPEDVNLQMNGVNVDNVIQGSVPVFGLGTASYTPVSPWTQGSAWANFSWTPTPNPPVPDLDIYVNLDVDVWVFARNLQTPTVNDTELITLGDNYAVSNATDVSWETNYLVSVPSGYGDFFFYNVTLPLNRDITFVSEPFHRYTNLSSGWAFGNPGDGVVNVSVYEIGLPDPNGFWMIRGTSPNMITNLQVWDDGLGQWVQTKTFRAAEDTRFRAVLPTNYQGDSVTFTVYDSYGEEWDTRIAAVDGSGYAVTSYVNLDAVSARVGDWEVHAFVDDSNSGSEVHNIGYFARAFDIDHSTQMSVKYPLEGRTSWSYNATYGANVFLQLRINDTDNGDLLPAGVMMYTGDFGSGTVNDMGTGEYSVNLDTGALPSNGQYDIDLAWTKANYDSLAETFTVNVIYDTDLYSSDAPGIDVPSGYDADLHVYFEDMLAQPVTAASITCNWSQSYTVVEESPGHYLLSLDTTGAPLDVFPVEITSSKDYFQSRSIILSVNVRELHTSAIPSSSLLSLPVGYTTSFTITYRDTDLLAPISGADSAISCNWSEIHESGDQNYTVAETANPGVYEVVIYSMDDDTLDSYDVLFNVEQYGAQNHSFVVTVELRTHLTSLYLNNSVDPTPYTGNISVNLVYYDVDANTGIVNGTTLGGYVELIITSPTLPSPTYYVTSVSSSGLYRINVPANQWGDIGSIELDITMNWIGVNLKYSNLSLSTMVIITAAPTDIYIGESPIDTAYGEDVSFSIVYFDLGGLTGVVNSTGPYAGNLHIYIDVLTAGHTLTQADMIILEIDGATRPGEYRITFDTDLLTGLGECVLKVWFNWTSGQLPYYQNQVIVVTVHASHRLTTVDWNPLPLTPYDEIVNLTLTYRDSLFGTPILNDPKLTITIPGYSFNIYYDGDVTGLFIIEVDTSAFTPGSHTFTVNVEWAGSPFYQNRTGVEIHISVRERYTSLTHGTYSPVEYGRTLHLNFTFRDLDDYSALNMDSGTLTLDAWLVGDYTVDDLGDGLYALHLDTSAFGAVGIFTVNVSIQYNGARYCADAIDLFYLSVVVRRTQLTSDLPDLAPYLTQASITVHYTDDSTGAGIVGAVVLASCPAASTPLQLGVNYGFTDNFDGSYTVSIDTVALGNFGPYTITITVLWTSGEPFYQTRIRDVDIEVSRRPASISITKSPLNTPFFENVTFEVSVIDGLTYAGISLNKTNFLLTHNGGTVITNAQYSITGSDGIYTISLSSLVLTSELEDEYPISVKFVWGDAVPYYGNSTTSTEVTIVGRFTQGTVLQTPPGYYFFNISALLEFSDYLSGSPVPGAVMTIRCLNETSTHWEVDNLDGTYTALIDSNSLSGLGRYFFEANFTWTGSPYYRNVTGILFSITVNPVSTALNFVLPAGVTYYLGEVVYANITYTAIEFGTGIDGATITTDWDTLYGTTSTITPLGNGIYEMTIDTSGLNASLYRFAVNASKADYLSQSISADILLAAIPVQIELVFSPTNPSWGDIIQLQANVTNLLTGQPIYGVYLNLTLGSVSCNMTWVIDGLYNCTVDTNDIGAGEFTITVESSLLNYESRVRDFQLRIDKIAAKMTASLDPQTAVNGQMVTIEVEYLIYSDSSPIEDVGYVTYSWVGGTGVLSWSAVDGKYIIDFPVSGASVGSHQILVQASSANFKSVSYQLTIEITEIATQLIPISGSVETVNFRDITNITVYLNNTDLGLPVVGANVSFGVGPIVGNLTELGTPGYYSAYINTSYLSVQEWTVSISSAKSGFAPSSIQFTLRVETIETAIVLHNTPATHAGYYGENVTFYFIFTDTHASEGVAGAITNYTLEHIRGSLVDLGNGTYSLTLDTSVVSAGSVPHDITVSFRKDNYDFAYGLVKLLVHPISTEIIGSLTAEFAVYDNYSMIFSFRDTLNDEWITDAHATITWEFGTAILTNLNNGSYMFGPTEANLPTTLQDRTDPYTLTLAISRGNYSRPVVEVDLTIREIATEVTWDPLPSIIHVGDTILVNFTYWDIDHNVPILDADLSVFTTSSLATDPGLVRETDLDVNHGNGSYTLGFSAPNLAFYTLRIDVDKVDYALDSVELDIYTVLSPEQEALVLTFQWGTMALLAVAALAALYFRVLSVPRLLRIIRRMISALSKGRIPKPANVPVRREMLLAIMNEDLSPVGIQKTIDDIAMSTVDVTAMDVEELLDELATVVGLTPTDIDTLRQDLDKMRPSERAGFINEVLKQERSRRARELAEAERVAEEGVPAGVEEERLSEDELVHLKERLLKMGIEETEADLMVEQAKNLSRAEIDALLSEIGGLEE
ncbi:MAG: hypothetical protein ThorAB25_07690 [Candidatus Thorarchaeota archaeon AB_25]|nr:MAG: hypothetical protein ThorAB25_07690 [Candidatus Thorarchaeota archaeon AB_25]